MKKHHKQYWQLMFRDLFPRTLPAFRLPIGVAVLFSIFLFSASPAEKKMRLLIADHDAQAAQSHLQHLTSYAFVNGIAGPKQTVVSVLTQKPGQKGSFIRFDLGMNQIYQKRWVITGIGNVIDLNLKRVVLDQKDRFVRSSGDSLIFFTNDIFRGKFYSVFDLKTTTYQQIYDPAYRALPGKDVETDCTLKNYKIYYYPLAAPKIELVKDAGYGEDVSMIAGAKSQCPIYWIDNDRFVYPNYSAARDFVSLMLVSVSTKQSEKLGVIDQLPANKNLSRFYTDAEGGLVYVCSRGHFRVDVSHKKVEILNELPVGHGFTIALNSKNPKGREIKHDGKLIGTYFCDPELARTAPGCIAFPFEMVFENDHFIQGAAAWTSDSEKWKTLSDSDIASVVGWIED
ncbi:MAG: hypothetical protein ACRCYO_05995 [Bacteroidia bacterium]